MQRYPRPDNSKRLLVTTIVALAFFSVALIIFAPFDARHVAVLVALVMTVASYVHRYKSDLMPKTPKRPRDVNPLAKLISDIATGDAEEAPDTRDPAAVAMGSKGGKARASSMSPDGRAEIARKAAAKRWGN